MKIDKWDRIGDLIVNKFSLGLVAEDINGKFYLKSPTESEESVLQFKTEDKFFSAVLNLPNMLKPVGKSQIGTYEFNVLPYIPNDLTDFVKKLSPPQLINEILMPLIDFLEALHASGYIHRDLKLENVRVNSVNGKLKIFVSDFGKATILQGHLSNKLSYLSQHSSPDMTLSPQIDIYSLGVIAYQLLFGFDFIKEFQMSGRSFEKILGSKKIDLTILDFIKRATEPSALYRLNTANECRRLLNCTAGDKRTNISISRYELPTKFEIYFEAMKDTFFSSGKSLGDFEQFAGPFGEKYYSRLEKWSLSSEAIILHLKQNDEIIGICEASIKGTTGMISTLFIREDKRGIGFGRKLQEALADFFKEKNIFMSKLNVVETNTKAISFYLKTGWSIVDERQYPDAIQMQKNIRF